MDAVGIKQEHPQCLATNGCQGNRIYCDFSPHCTLIFRFRLTGYLTFLCNVRRAWANRKNGSKTTKCLSSTAKPATYTSPIQEPCSKERSFPHMPSREQPFGRHHHLDVATIQHNICLPQILRINCTHAKHIKCIRRSLYSIRPGRFLRRPSFLPPGRVSVERK